MPKRTCRTYNLAFKANVVYDSICGDSALADLSARFEVHPNQIQFWKKQAVDGPNLLLQRKNRIRVLTTDVGRRILQAQAAGEVGVNRNDPELETIWINCPVFPSYPNS